MPRAVPSLRERAGRLPLTTGTGNLAEAGVQHAWLLKPSDRTLEVLHLQDGAWTIVGVCSGSDVVRIKPFEAVELELARLWVEPAPPPV